MWIQYWSFHFQVLCQNLDSKICVIHDVWTTRGGKCAFINVVVSYIDENWESHFVHLTLKLVAWNHYGHLLARPVGKFLIRHGLHEKIIWYYIWFYFLFLNNMWLSVFEFLINTHCCTDNGLGIFKSGLAKELEKMFKSADDPVYWNSSSNQIQSDAIVTN